jgi:glycosyltransferase involved in cell wall biosynthesis
MKNLKPKILCFTPFYLPGYRAGGTVRAIANFVEYFGKDFRIHIVCLNYDLFEINSYNNVKLNVWNKLDNAKIFYSSKKNLSVIRIKRLLNEEKYDLLYLNSFFSYRFTLVPFLLNKFCSGLKKPCIIATRGEFSPEALKISSIKKKIYFSTFKYLNLFESINWQASTKQEKKDISRKLDNTATKIFIAPDLVTSSLIRKSKSKFRAPGPLRLLFLSRIVPMKNLYFLLKVLIKVHTFIELSIYGPKEDFNYWYKCKSLIDKLAPNIKVTIGAAVPNDETLNIFEKHDLFVLPTLGENFGHAIFESIASGLPAIISNRTFWKPDQDCLEVLKLDENLWIEAIIKWSKFSDRTLKIKRQAALNYAKKYYNSGLSIKKNKELFYSVFN